MNIQPKASRMIAGSVGTRIDFQAACSLLKIWTPVNHLFRLEYVAVVNSLLHRNSRVRISIAGSHSGHVSRFKWVVGTNSLVGTAGSIRI